MIRAKFKCTSVTLFESGGEEVSMSPVIDGSDANVQWSEYTPNGSLAMTVTAKGAVGAFKPGREYVLTFSEAGKED